MLFPKFSEGLEAVLFIALNAGADPVSSKQISAYQDVMPRHLEPMLQILVKEGILKGTKGPRGGYTLAREKRKVCVSEIFSMLSVDAALKRNKEDSKNSIRKNIIREIDHDIAICIESTLAALTIEDLCRKINSETKPNGKADFNI
jgi:Rrf2 family protein